MIQFIDFIKDCFTKVVQLLDSLTFNINGVEVSYFSFLLVMFVLGIFVTFIWKGVSAR